MPFGRDRAQTAYSSFSTAGNPLKVLPAPRGTDSPATIGRREQHASERDQAPGDQGIDQHSNQRREFKDAPGADGLIVKDAVKGANEDVAEVVKCPGKIASLVRAQQAEDEAQAENDFQHAQQKVDDAGNPVTQA